MRLGVPISQNRKKKDKRERHDFTVFVRGPVFLFRRGENDERD